MNYRRLMYFLSTLGPIGYVKASGTLASCIVFPVALVLRMLFSNVVYAFIVCILMVVAYIFIKQSQHLFEHADPHEIVLDECIGCLVTLFFVPLTLGPIIMSFVLFRFFDIVKCFGIKQCESFDGAYGILIDDIVAGLFAGIGTCMLVYGYQWLLL
jgi:phosphatidylglycerophosphatase A